jgi:hypothetical protein
VESRRSKDGRPTQAHFPTLATQPHPARILTCSLAPSSLHPPHPRPRRPLPTAATPRPRPASRATPSCISRDSTAIASSPVQLPLPPQQVRLPSAATASSPRGSHPRDARGAVACTAPLPVSVHRHPVRCYERRTCDASCRHYASTLRQDGRRPCQRHRYVMPCVMHNCSRRQQPR